jgi:hypothetical protein
MENHKDIWNLSGKKSRTLLVMVLESLSDYLCCKGENNRNKIY